MFALSRRRARLTREWRINYTAAAPYNVIYGGGARARGARYQFREINHLSLYWPLLSTLLCK